MSKCTWLHRGDLVHCQDKGEVVFEVDQVQSVRNRAYLKTMDGCFLGWFDFAKLIRIPRDKHIVRGEYKLEVSLDAQVDRACGVKR